MILSICGFNCSGSSAVIHLLKEYDNIKVIDFECMLLDMPDGIKDLDYAFHAGGSYFREDKTFERFLKAIKNQRYFQSHSNKAINAISEKYIDELTGASWNGRSVYDYAYKDSVEKYFWFVRRTFEKVVYLRKKTRVGLTNRKMRIADTNKDFYGITREYMDEVVCSFGGDLSLINVMDQLMPPVQTEEYLKYVNNGKAIVVDRDPRDMFLNLQLGVDCRCVPTTTEEFVKYHKLWWKNIDDYNMSSDVLRINFEDLIYKYDETLKTIESFLGIVQTDRRGSVFKPEKSVNNTQIFRRVKGYEKDIALIEKELSDCLYPFPSETTYDLTGDYIYHKQTGVVKENKQ